MSSPLLGSGIIPSDAVGTQLADITRRAFVPKLVVQLYQATPLLSALVSNLEDADGGISSVTIPVQGTAMVNHQWSDYSGSFASPTQLQGIQDANFNLKLSILPIPFYAMEGALQVNHAVVNLLKARMADATNVGADAWATALFNNYTNNQQIIGLPGAVDDTTNLTTYGGINRSTYTWWKSKVYSAGSVAPTRNLVLQYAVGTQKAAGGEMPNFAVCGMGTWLQLSTDFTSLERYNITPDRNFQQGEGSGPGALFTALSVGGVPVFADPYCPEGTMYFLNTKYIALYMHRMARFAFTGFYSLIPNLQLGYVGAVVSLLELANAKPSASSRVSGFTYETI